jgi:ADP-ribosylglycohydrolase
MHAPHSIDVDSRSAQRPVGRYLGCIFGLAAGDALGAPVEFLSLDGIRERFGPSGVTDLEPWGGHPAGSFTDDTQMSLATAIGLLSAFRDEAEFGTAQLMGSLFGAYGGWLESQKDPAEQRAPGRTCVTALGSGRLGTIDRPLNDSKGCGGVMRVAPIGLALPVDLAFHHAVAAAAITHGHPSGYLSAGVLAEIVARVVEGADIMAAAVAACNALAAYDGNAETLEAVQRALELAGRGADPESAIEALGSGWVGEEALAIGLYAAIRFAGDFRAACSAAVNHSGDSDSTGSICGAILGAAYGVDAIPASWIERLERRSLLERTARSLHQAFVEGRLPE